MWSNFVMWINYNLFPVPYFAPHDKFTMYAVLSWFTLFRCKIHFVAILLVCGAKIDPKSCLWSKNDKCDVCVMVMVIIPGRGLRTQANLRRQGCGSEGLNKITIWNWMEMKSEENWNKKGTEKIKENFQVRPMGVPALPPVQSDTLAAKSVNLASLVVMNLTH